MFIRTKIMLPCLTFLLCLCFPFSLHADLIKVSDPGNAKDDTYRNPIIFADYSDPDIVASPDGKTFYMTASSFQCAPGLPILKSTDLVNWTLCGYALDAVPPRDYYDSGVRHGKGVWAPCIRFHDGEYYIFWGDPDFGIFMIKTDNPEGEWGDPVLVKEGKGMIDPTPIWTRDGKAYLVNSWAASRTGFNSVLTAWEMSPDATKIISSPRMVFDGNDGVNHTVEGPKLYWRDGYFYILSPAGGVVDGWQLALRSENIYGPYESRIVMSQGSSPFNGPHQGGLVTTATGEDWFVNFQDRGLYGRVIHLNPVEWRDGWPVIGIDGDGDGCGTPVSRHRKPSGLKPGKDDTMTASLFQWHSNYHAVYGFPTPDALMRIYGHRLSEEFVNFWEVPNLWLHKFPAESFTTVARVKISAKETSEDVSSGIIVMGRNYCRVGLTKKGDRFVLVRAECRDAENGTQEIVEEICDVLPSRTYEAGLYSNMECDIWFRLKVLSGGKCFFEYSLDGKNYSPVSGAFDAREGKWIGAKAGFYSITPHSIGERGWIDIIDYEIDR